jgi:glycosyltransferase involved in cell wall biosynthesis
MLIEALHLLRNRTNLKVAVAGAESFDSVGYLGELKAQVRKLDLVDRVVFTGPYPAGSSDPSYWLYASDICVLPLRMSVNLNNSSLSAPLRHGVPTIVTESSATSNRLDAAYIKRFTRTVVDADAGSLAAHISELADDPAERQIMRTLGLEYAKQLYSPLAYVDAITDFETVTDTLSLEPHSMASRQLATVPS